MRLSERVAALEAELAADSDDLEAVVVRTVSGRLNGTTYTDDKITGLRGSDGRVTERLPHESIEALTARAAAAVPAGDPRRRVILLACYADAPARDAA